MTFPVIILLVLNIIFGCHRFAWSDDSSTTTKGNSGTSVNTGTVVWGQSLSAGSSAAQFNAVATDSAGNAYAVGSQFGNVSYSYGSQSVTGPYASGNNAVIVKYDASGTAVWGNAPSAGTNTSQYNAVAVDNLGNVYAAGFQAGTGSFTFGGQTSTAPYTGNNVLLVKYDAAGTVVWTRTVSTATNASEIKSLAVDASGNILASGYQNGTAVFTYGGQSATSTYSFSNVLLIKYDSSGTAQWARTVSAGSNLSYFYGVTTDTSGNVYAAGYQNSTSAFTYGGQSATGSFPGANAILVKYDSLGTAVWARTMSGCSIPSQFNSVTADTYGNIYASGCQIGSGTCIYSGQSITSAYSGGNNAILVKFDSLGTAIWARTLSTAPGATEIKGVATDITGNVFLAGYQYGNGTYLFGVQSATGSYASGNNVSLIQLDASGTAIWIRTVSSGANVSQFYAVATDAMKNVFAAGLQTNNSPYIYGSQTLAGANATGANPILVKYQ